MSPVRGTKVVAVLEELVEENPGITARRLAQLLAELGLPGYDKSDVNRVLYSLRPALEVRPGRDGPAWFARPSESATRDDQGHATAKKTETAVSRVPLPPLHEWQSRAVAAWRAAGSRGVVEAVTGAGKTRVAVEALREDHAAGMAAVVIVPTPDLMNLRQAGDQAGNQEL